MCSSVPLIYKKLVLAGHVLVERAWNREKCFSRECGRICDSVVMPLTIKQECMNLNPSWSCSISIIPQILSHFERKTVLFCLLNNQVWCEAKQVTLIKNIFQLMLKDLHSSAILALLELLVVPPWQCCWEQSKPLFSQLPYRGLFRMCNVPLELLAISHDSYQNSLNFQ